MKKILLTLTVCFSLLLCSGCTNENGSSDVTENAEVTTSSMTLPIEEVGNIDDFVEEQEDESVDAITSFGVLAKQWLSDTKSIVYNEKFGGTVPDKFTDLVLDIDIDGLSEYLMLYGEDNTIGVFGFKDNELAMYDAGEYTDEVLKNSTIGVYTADIETLKTMDTSIFNSGFYVAQYDKNELYLCGVYEDTSDKYVWIKSIGMQDNTLRVKDIAKWGIFNNEELYYRYNENDWVVTNAEGVADVARYFA